jgi:hypothetical protein
MYAEMDLLENLESCLRSWAAAGWLFALALGGEDGYGWAHNLEGQLDVHSRWVNT